MECLRVFSSTEGKPRSISASNAHSKDCSSSSSGDERANTALLGFEGSVIVAEEHVFDFCFFWAGEGVSSSMTPEGGGRKDLKTACSFLTWVGAAWPNPSSSICRWQCLYQHPLSCGEIDRQGGHGRHGSWVDSREFAQCYCSESMKVTKLESRKQSGRIRIA